MNSTFHRIIVALITFAIGVLLVSSVSRFQERQPAKVNDVKIAVTYAAKPAQAASHTWGLDTRHLDTNSNANLTWHWLKKEIARCQTASEYRKYSILLPLEDGHNYSVSLTEMTIEQVKSERGFVKSRQFVPPRSDHHYAWMYLNIDDYECPTWSGVVDLDEPKLLFFQGSGA